MSRARIILVLILIGGVILWLSLSFRQTPSSSDLTQAYGVNLTSYDRNGEPAWHLEAKEGEMEGDTGRFTDVRVEFLSDDTDRLLAKGEALTFTRDEATLEGGVEVRRGEGYRLTTEEITWAEATRELRAGCVTITTEGGTIEAAGFRYELENDRSFLCGGVSAEIDRSSPLRVTGEAAEEADGLLIVTGEVTVEGEEETYRCARLEYDTESETVSLLQGVEGTFPEGEIHAGALLLTPDGLTGRGGVSFRLNKRFFGGGDDT